MGSRETVGNKQAMKQLEEEEEETGIRKPQTSWFCKIRAVPMPISAALAKAAETTSEMHFSSMLEETSTF